MAISSKPTSRYRILAARFHEVLQFPDVARATNAALAHPLRGSPSPLASHEDVSLSSRPCRRSHG
jgi:hypothetical protein